MYRHLMTAAAVAIVVSFATTPGFSQDDAYTLPEICTKNAMDHDMGTMPMAMGGMDQAHKDLMAGMDAMDANMNKGMMAADIDVAFVCGMIAHHQGAIDMAKAELTHGDDQWAKDMAQKVIDAQEQEIKDMKAWLAEQAS